MPIIQNQPLKFKWRCVADSEGPETGEFDLAESRATMTIDVDLSRPAERITLLQVIADIVGYPAVSWPTFAQVQSGQYTQAQLSGLLTSGIGGILTRKLPWQHPRFSFMWASKIGNVLGRQFKSKKWSPVTSLPYSEYNYYRLTILYTTPPYEVRTDTQVGADPVGLTQGAEFLRFTQMEDPEAAIENLTRQGAYLRWTNNSPGGYPPGAAGNIAIPGGGINIRVPKLYYKFTWHQVPKVGLFGTIGIARPTNIMNCMGKINGFAFPQDYPDWQFPPDTLLFLKPTWKAETVPLTSDLMGDVNATYMPRTYRVTFHCLYFNPPTQPFGGVENRGYPPVVGHNGVPAPGSQFHFRVTMNAGNLENQGINTSNPKYRLYKPCNIASLWFLTYPGTTLPVLPA
jgi:hypothetical protein